MAMVVEHHYTICCKPLNSVTSHVGQPSSPRAIKGVKTLGSPGAILGAQAEAMALKE